jgi:thiol-disulfide isomerase/thioredoxin
MVVCAGLAVFAAGPPVAAQVAPPKLGTITLAKPLAKPFDEQADAGPAVDAALARARVSGKRVLLELGGNWCPDCRVLGATLAVPAIKAFVGRYFEVVAVDVGRFNKNLDIPARFGLVKLDAVPTVLVLSKDGTLLNPTELIALGDARTMAPKEIVAWLARWAPPTR